MAISVTVKEYVEKKDYDDVLQQLKKANEHISELESELAVKEDLLKLSSRIKNTRERIEKLEKIHDEYEEKIIEELEDRHMQDCITINQLHVTIDTLVDRYAKLREMKGL